MIGLHKDDGSRLAVTIGEGSAVELTLNDPSDEPTSTIELNSVITAGSFETTVDGSRVRPGAIIGPAKRTLYVVRLEGTIRAASLAELYDLKRSLAAAFDPALATRISPDTNGFLPLHFGVPTEDTENWATGLVPSRYLARGQDSVVPVDSIYSGFGAFFSARLYVRDARRESQATATRTGAGTATNLGDSPAKVNLEITMAGSGSSIYTITRVGDYSDHSLVLDLSGLSNGDVVTVDMEEHTIEVDGVAAPSRWASGDWWDLDPGDNTISLSGTTNATTELEWRHTWVV